MSFTNEDVLQILAVLDATGFDELRIETGDYKLYLRRSIPATEVPAPAAPVSAADVAAAPQQASPDVHAGSNTEAGSHAVTAPMLGTFYGAPQPGAPPFVTVGATVEHDTVIGILEVMKLMNSVCAGTRGTVVEIVARDGALVEFGETLVRIAPSSA